MLKREEYIEEIRRVEDKSKFFLQSFSIIFFTIIFFIVNQLVQSEQNLIKNTFENFSSSNLFTLQTLLGFYSIFFIPGILLLFIFILMVLANNTFSNYFLSEELKFMLFKKMTYLRDSVIFGTIILTIFILYLILIIFFEYEKITLTLYSFQLITSFLGIIAVFIVIPLYFIWNDIKEFDYNLNTIVPMVLNCISIIAMYLTILISTNGKIENESTLGTIMGFLLLISLINFIFNFYRFSKEYSVKNLYSKLK